MKKGLSVCAALLCAAVLLLTAGAADYAAVVWEDTASVVSTVGTYPRMTRLSDGRLLVTHGVNVSLSADEGKTWDTAQPLPAPQQTALSGSHRLNPANHQPFVLLGGGADGRDLVMIAYRCDTAGFGASTVGEFYTSLRLVTSCDGGETYGDEIVLIENTCLRRTEEHANDNSIYSSYRGYWEPMMIRADDDTVLLYYADDLSVEAEKAPWRQQIRYFTYSIASGKWNTDTTDNIAIDGSVRTSSTLGSRDGMPGVTRLADGSFAMVIEAQDYNTRSYIRPDGTKTATGYAGLVITLAFSEDGRNWPVEKMRPIAAPTNLFTAGSIAAGYSCGAPYIATLPDGRVAVSYQSSEDYIGDRGVSLPYVLRTIVSNEPLTYNSDITATEGGVSPSFTALESPFAPIENEYQVWNSLCCIGSRLYALSSTRVTGKAGSAAIKINRSVPVEFIIDMDGDGEINLADVACLLRALATGAYPPSQLDYNGDGRFDIADVLYRLTAVLTQD